MSLGGPQGTQCWMKAKSTSQLLPIQCKGWQGKVLKQLQDGTPWPEITATAFSAKEMLKK